MATRALLEMLNAAIGTPHMAVVNFAALHKLLKAIIGQLEQQELSVLEPGQSLTPGLAKDQDTKEQPGQEKEEDGALGMVQQPWEPQEQLDGKDTLERTGSNSKVSSMAKEAMPKTPEEEERDICKKRASLQDLWEEINKLKEVQFGMAEDTRAVQKVYPGVEQVMREMKDAHSSLAEDVRALQEACSGLADDIQEIQETLGLARIPCCLGGRASSPPGIPASMRSGALQQ